MEQQLDIRAYSDAEYDTIAQVIYHYRVKHDSAVGNPVIRMRLDAYDSTLSHCQHRIPFDASAECSLAYAALLEFGKFLQKDQRDMLPHLRTKINCLENELHREEQSNA